jgi:hypothetical protein
MKAFIFLSMTLLIVLLALTEYRNPSLNQVASTESKDLQSVIEQDMNEKFQRRDLFREKGNSGKYLKTYVEISYF